MLEIGENFRAQEYLQASWATVGADEDGIDRRSREILWHATII